jgi:hypothetical protein
MRPRHDTLCVTREGRMSDQQQDGQGGWYERGTPIVKFRAGYLSEELRRRGDRWGIIAKRALENYYALLNTVDVTKLLTDQELSYMEQTFKQSQLSSYDVDTVPLYILLNRSISMISRIYGASISAVVYRRIVGKLEHLSPLEQYAVRDWLEQRGVIAYYTSRGSPYRADDE